LFILGVLLMLNIAFGVWWSTVHPHIKDADPDLKPDLLPRSLRRTSAAIGSTRQQYGTYPRQVCERRYLPHRCSGVFVLCGRNCSAVRLGCRPDLRCFLLARRFPVRSRQDHLSKLKSPDTQRGLRQIALSSGIRLTSRLRTRQTHREHEERESDKAISYVKWLPRQRHANLDALTLPGLLNLQPLPVGKSDFWTYKVPRMARIFEPLKRELLERGSEAWENQMKTDAENARSLSVLTGGGCRMDESAPAASDRVPARGESSVAGATR